MRAREVTPLSPVTPEGVSSALAIGAEIALEADGVRLERRDWRWFLELPEERIAFVAETEEDAVRLCRERELLRRIASRVSFAVPRPLEQTAGAAVDVREKVRGLTGRALHDEALADPTRGRSLAEAMGRALAELHAIPVAEVSGLLARGPLWPVPLSRMRARLPGTTPAVLETQMLEALEHYDAIAADDADLVLVHGDFGSHNFAFDSRTHALAGVFDFEEATLADYHADFRYTPSYGEPILLATIAAYERHGGRPVSLSRVRLHHAMVAMSFLAWAVEDPVVHERGTRRSWAQALTWVEQAVRAALELGPGGGA